MSDLRRRFTLWFLRRFQAFRELEHRLDLLSEPRMRAKELLRQGSLARVEAEVLHTLLLCLPCFVHAELLPTQRVGWIGDGEVRVRIFEGGGAQ